MSEPNAEHEESADAVVAAAQHEGLSVSRHQLERWHRAGALPAPRQLPHPRGGSVSLYPPGTRRQVIALARALLGTRRLDQAAFEIWIAGYEVGPSLVRRYLERIARWHDRLADLVQRAGFGTEELPNQALELVEGAERMRTKGTAFASMHERLRSRDERQTLVRILLDATAGRYAPTPSPDQATYLRESEGLLVERALGVTEGRTTRVLDAGPWVSGDPEDFLTFLPQLVSGGPLGRRRKQRDRRGPGGGPRRRARDHRGDRRRRRHVR